MPHAPDPPLSPMEEEQYDAAREAGFELIERPESWGLPSVEGHQVSLAEWRAFTTFTSGIGSEADMVSAAAEAAGVTPRTVRDWKRKSWWTELFERHVTDEQQMFHAGLLSKRKEALDGFSRVLKGDGDLPGGMATAIVAGVGLLTKIGKKPLQDSRNITTINQNSIDNRGGVLVTGRTLGDMDQGDLLKIVTGEMKLAEE